MQRTYIVLPAGRSAQGGQRKKSGRRFMGGGPKRTGWRSVGTSFAGRSLVWPLWPGRPKAADRAGAHHFPAAVGAGTGVSPPPWWPSSVKKLNSVFTLVAGIKSYKYWSRMSCTLATHVLGKMTMS